MRAMRRVLALAPLLVALVGCHTAVSTTEVSSEGGFKRTVKYSIAKFELGPDTEAPKPAEAIAFDDPDTWTVKATESDRASELEATREVAPGQAGGGYRLRSKGEDALRSTVTVNERADGTLEYVETFTLLRPASAPPSNEGFRKRLGAALTPFSPTEAELKAIDEETGRSVMWAVFGPPEPRLGLLLTNPEGALRSIRVASGQALTGALRTHLGDRLNDAQRRAVVRETLAELTQDELFDPEERTGGVAGAPPSEGEDSSPPPVAITVLVKGPGELVETNGIFDPVTGEVFWSLYDSSTEVGTVTLRAVFKP